MVVTTDRIDQPDWHFRLASGVLFVFLIAWLLFATQSTNKEFWKSQQWVGKQDEWFAGIRANLRSFKSIRAFSEDGHNKFSKQKLAFAVPVFGSDPWIVLPPSATRELLEKTDEEVDAAVIHDEQIQRQYTQGRIGMHIGAQNFHHDVVRRQLTRKLPLLTADVYDELRLGFDTYWGRDTNNLRKVNIYRTCTKIVSRAANRVFVGNQLCRNDDFLEHSRLYTEGLFKSAAFINLVPKLIRPAVAPMLTFPNRKHKDICMKACLPLVKERLDHTIRKRDDANYEWTPPVDALQWLVEEGLKQDDPRESEAEMLTFRVLSLNMVAIHTTSMTITSTVLDLFSAPDAAEIVAGLREECTRVLQKHDGAWSKQGINELYRIDSTIRESMRRSDLGWLAVNRMITAPDGVTFNEGNIHVPQGVRVCVASHAIHRDEDTYPSPLEFDAFRFSRAREGHGEPTQSQVPERAVSSEAQDSTHNASAKNGLDLKNTSLITTSDDFLGFGHGRHACPGRFFATQELKLMLAYLVMNYDVEPLAERPQNTFINGSRIPPANALLGVKMRQ